MKITSHDIKAALLDERFRKTLPEEFDQEVQEFIKNPNCACNHPLYIKILKKAKNQLTQYFPSKTQLSEKEIEAQFDKVAKNNWQVINCSVDELASELRKIGTGRKQLDVARWNDQVTVVINHLDELY